MYARSPAPEPSRGIRRWFLRPHEGEARRNALLRGQSLRPLARRRHGGLTLQKPKPHVSRRRLRAEALLCQVGEKAPQSVQDERLWTALVDELGYESNSKRACRRRELRCQDDITTTGTGEVPFLLHQFPVFGFEVICHGGNAIVDSAVVRGGHDSDVILDKTVRSGRGREGCVFFPLRANLMSVRTYQGAPAP